MVHEPSDFGFLTLQFKSWNSRRLSCVGWSDPSGVWNVVALPGRRRFLVVDQHFVTDCRSHHKVVNDLRSARSAMGELKYSVFLVLTRREGVWKWRFGTPFWSHLQGSGHPKSYTGTSRRIITRMTEEFDPRSTLGSLTPWRWDRQSSPKRWLTTKEGRRVNNQKSQHNNSAAAETRNYI